MQNMPTLLAKLGKTGIVRVGKLVFNTKGTIMKFVAGDKVVVPAHGVGTIIGIEPFLGEDMHVVYFTRQQLTCRIPVRKVGAVRALSTPQQLYSALSELTKTRYKSRRLWSQRKVGYYRDLHSGDIRTLCVLARNLFATDDERMHDKQSYTERTIFEDAYNRIVEEVTVAAGIDHVRVAAFVDEALATKKLPREFTVLRTGRT